MFVFVFFHQNEGSASQTTSFIADVIKAVWAGKIMLISSYIVIAKKAIYKLCVTSVVI